MLKLCVLFPLAVALVGCSSSSPSGPQHAPHGDARELAVILQENYASEAIEDCDRIWKERSLEISNALEQRQDLIRQLSQDTGPTHKLISLGNLKFRELPLSKNSHVSEWKEEPSGWNEVWDYYQLLLKKNSDRGWVTLNSMARATAIDDRDRLVYFSHPDLHKDMERVIAQASFSIESCLADPSCYELENLTIESRAYLRNGFAYAENYSIFTNPNRSAEKRRSTLRTIKGWVDSDLRRYNFKKNDSGHLRGHKLEIEMTSALSGAIEFMNDVVQKYWSNSEGALLLRDSSSANVFKAIFHDMIGGRAYVLRSEKAMHLFNHGSTRTIAHEIGHVLGFPDAYYTTWNKQTCQYKLQYREGDLMSSGDRVLPEHWNSLKSHYSH